MTSSLFIIIIVFVIFTRCGATKTVMLGGEGDWLAKVTRVSDVEDIRGRNDGSRAEGGGGFWRA